jgi:subtilase family serine protease
MLSKFQSVVFVLLSVVMIGVAQQPAEKQSSVQLNRFKNLRGVRLAMASTAAPTDAECRAQIGFPCYSPQEIYKAYGLTPLLQAGYDGAGETIVIIDSFGSPTIEQDLKTFDAAFGLPDPPSFTVLAPLGTVPFDPTNNDMVGWAEETSLDVEWSHAMAPGAKIVLLTSPVDETEGVQGMPEFLALETYALDHHLGNIVSQSWGATENTLFTLAGQKVFAGFESMYERGGNLGVTFLASAGDDGTGNPDVNGNIYPFPTVGYPASSPHVTAVGGTSLYADTSGNYQSETAWDDIYGATGGGVSQEFGEPLYELLVLPLSKQKSLTLHRGIPDIAFNADPNTAVLVYLSIPSVPSGFYLFGGTSEGSPAWAGIIADTNQLAGHPTGFLNFKLYALGGSRVLYDVFRDITVGDNAFNGVSGYDATKGWDLTTGWGTPDLGNLMKELAKLE